MIVRIFAYLSKILLKEIAVWHPDRWLQKEVTYECIQRICTLSIFMSADFLKPTLWLLQFRFLSLWNGRIWGHDGSIWRQGFFLLSAICREQVNMLKVLSVCNFQIGLYILKISCTASTLENKSSLYIYIYNETLLKYKDEPKEDISHQATTRWVFLLTACLSSNDSQWDIFVFVCIAFLCL